MKKQYISPLTLTIRVTATHLCTPSITGVISNTTHQIVVGGDAEEGEEGVRRFHGVWDDEEE
jgi:hypothetical protein